MNTKKTGITEPISFDEIGKFMKGAGAAPTNVHSIAAEKAAEPPATAETTQPPTKPARKAPAPRVEAGDGFVEVRIAGAYSWLGFSTKIPAPFNLRLNAREREMLNAAKRVSATNESAQDIAKTAIMNEVKRRLREAGMDPNRKADGDE
jgi:hypothetical protein